jgi:hypothetical protein
MPIAGQRTAVKCALGDNIVHTVGTATTEKITISFSSIDNTPITMKVYHVKQGNAGTHVKEDEDLLASPMTVDTKPILLRDLYVSSGDDIVVYSSVADKLIVNINSGGPL